MNTKCLIVEDHQLVSDSLAITLNAEFPDFEITQVNSSKEAIKFIEQNLNLATCFLLLDLGLADQHGISVLMHLRKTKLLDRFLCLVMSGVENQGNVNLCKKEGARGFISKSENVGILIDAVKLIRNGGEYFPLNRYEDAGNFLETAIRLAPHLRRTLDLVVQGYMTKIIADELGLTDKSAEFNVNKLLTLFSVNTRAELTREAQKCGYVIQYKKTKH